MIQDIHIVSWNVFLCTAAAKIMTHVLHVAILTTRKPFQAQFLCINIYAEVLCASIQLQNNKSRTSAITGTVEVEAKCEMHGTNTEPTQIQIFFSQVRGSIVFCLNQIGYINCAYIYSMHATVYFNVIFYSWTLFIIGHFY